MEHVAESLRGDAERVQHHFGYAELSEAADPAAYVLGSPRHDDWVDKFVGDVPRYRRRRADRGSQRRGQLAKAGVEGSGHIQMVGFHVRNHGIASQRYRATRSFA